MAPALHRLTALNLQGCSTLTDAGLEKLACLTALAALNLSECSGISGGGAAAWRLPHLTALSLQNCAALDDSGVAALAGLTALRRCGGACLPLLGGACAAPACHLVLDGQQATTAPWFSIHHAWFSSMPCPPSLPAPTRPAAST